MKKLGHEEIGGCWFAVYQVDKPKDLYDLLHRAETNGGRKLDDVYGKYSDTKKRIFEDWKQWADDTHGVIYLGVASHNVFVFTLSFVYLAPKFGHYAYAVGCISKGSNKLFVW